MKSRAASKAQLQVLAQLGIHGLDLRAVWDKNIAHLSDAEAHFVRRLCDQHNIVVTCLGSPVGKSSILDSLESEEERLIRLFEIAHIVGTRCVRVFSFYPPPGAEPDTFVSRSAERLFRLTELAARADIQLLLENEVGLVGDIPSRCAAILRAVNSPHLHFAWDSANFVLSGVSRPVDVGWRELSSFIRYVHIKDAHEHDGQVCVAGEGDGQIAELLSHLIQTHFRGILSLEPHLTIAGHSSGFSGEDGMEHATVALRRVFAQVGAHETHVRDI